MSVPSSPSSSYVRPSVPSSSVVVRPLSVRFVESRRPRRRPLSVRLFRPVVVVSPLSVLCPFSVRPLSVRPVVRLIITHMTSRTIRRMGNTLSSSFHFSICLIYIVCGNLLGVVLIIPWGDRRRLRQSQQHLCQRRCLRPRWRPPSVAADVRAWAVQQRRCRPYRINMILLTRQRAVTSKLCANGSKQRRCW